MSDVIDRIKQRIDVLHDTADSQPDGARYCDLIDTLESIEVMVEKELESAKEPQDVPGINVGDKISRAVVLEKIRQIKDGTMISPVFSLMEIENFVRNTTQECEWKFDADEYCWFTDCGNAHYFESGDVIDNEHKFCPYCGKEIEV